jgi:[ribosomal protein S5]-alanine N-acetyltransferase
MHLTGERITLRSWRTGDEQSLATHGNNRKIWRNLTSMFPSPYTLDDAVQWIEHCQHPTDHEFHFAIEFNGEAVGGCGAIFLKDVHSRTAELGYWLGETCWGQGLASEAVALLTDHLFTTTDCLRIQAKVFAWNPASARVLIKNGYTLESIQRNAIFKDGEVTDALMHVRLRPE